MISHRACPAEFIEEGFHTPILCDIIARDAIDISHGQRTNFSPQDGMQESRHVTARLKRLREMTEPRLTVRATAEKLGMASSTYAAYESDQKYKKSLLPQHLAASLADLFAQYGVDRKHVLALGGLTSAGELERTPESLAEQLDAVLLPEIEVGYSMGGGADIEDFPVVQMIPFSRAWLRSLTDTPAAMLFVARGDGDSMMPTLLDQDIVIIDRSQKKLRNQDRIWAVAYGGFGMIKRLRGLPDGTIEINSDNQHVSPIRATEDEMFIIGRVVGIIRRI